MGVGNNTLNISGTLTNNSQLTLYGNGDAANVGTLNNNANGSLNVFGTGSVANVGTLVNQGDVNIGAGASDKTSAMGSINSPLARWVRKSPQPVMRF